MANMLTRDEVLHVAKLARLALSEAEIEKFTKQLNSILEYVHKISELDTANVPATAHILPVQNVVRDDASAHESLGSGKVVALAPEKEGSFIVVPPVIDIE